MEEDAIKADIVAALNGYYATIGIEPDVKEVKAAYRSFEIPRPPQFDAVKFATYVGEYLRDRGYPLFDPVQRYWGYQRALTAPASHAGQEAYAIRIDAEWTYFIVRKEPEPPAQTAR